MSQLTHADPDLPARHVAVHCTVSTACPHTVAGVDHDDAANRLANHILIDHTIRRTR